ncbi:MAG: LPS export ABC transporter periplasmic protein LptC [Candidatus Hydrogenedentes bacterium]|nr:LPS export ABC transporter periplasmic protein LptC [Candidatus Hydrogenedentota bacterium]
MRRGLALACAFLAAACSQKPVETTVAPAPAQTAEMPAASPDAAPVSTPGQIQEPEDFATIGNTTLRFFDDVLESDQPKTPTFELRAPKLSMTEDNVWVVEQATAVAFAEDGSETTFVAGAGRFDDNTKTAILSGGVNVTFGTQQVALQDMTWSNETHTASSSNPVTVTDGETRLEAASMEYHAHTKTLLLHGLSGTVSMKRAQAE